MPVTPNNIRDAKKYIHNMSPTGGTIRDTDGINCVSQLTTTEQRVWNKNTLGFRSWDKRVPSPPLRVMCSSLTYMMGRFPQTLPIAGGLDKMAFKFSFQPELVCDSVFLLNPIWFHSLVYLVTPSEWESFQGCF